MAQGKRHSLHKAPICPHRQMTTCAMKCFWRIWQDMASMTCGNYLGIYGATSIGIASQTSNNRNIPFIRKGIYGLNKMVAWMRWIHEMAWERLGFKGHLSMERKYAQVSSPTR